jgi:hypothetical protein
MESLWPDRYPVKAIPSCVEDCKECIREERFDIERVTCLRGKEKEIGPLAWSKEMQTTPRASESSLFKIELFQKNYDPTLFIAPCYTTKDKPDWLPKDLTVIQGWDFDQSETIGSAWQVGFTLGFRPNGNRYVLNIVRYNGLPYEVDEREAEKGRLSQLLVVKMQAALFEPHLIVVENNIFQSIYEKELIRTTSLPIVGNTTGAQKSDLSKGVPSLLIALQNQKYCIPRGDQNSIDITDSWISECEAFGWKDDKLHGVGEFDDQVMAWWMAETGWLLLNEGYVPKYVPSTMVLPGTGWKKKR